MRTRVMNEKFFNTAGPVIPEDHYMVDPLRRVDYDEIISLIDRQRYFVLHAPRQTGKTTSLLAMVKKINGDGKYHCAYMNVEAAQTARNDVNAGMKAILYEFERSVEGIIESASLAKSIPSIIEDVSGHVALRKVLSDCCESLAKPLVLFIDEIDALVGDVLVSVLRQLRTGYTDRPRSFPISVMLCGVRDVRDYRIRQSDGEIITGGSCFNIKAESLRLGDFSQDEIRELYEQHTEATGQTFDEGVYPKVWLLTHGQPWLTNALVNRATSKIPEGWDRKNNITVDIMEQAAEALILERATHLDQLTDKLREERVRRVIAPMAAGEPWPNDSEKPLVDDIQYAIDLGLIRRDDGKSLVISNDIYMEIIPRELTAIMQDNLVFRAEQPWYVSGGKIDMPKLLRDFQQFFRENAGSWLGDYEYKEAGFQLMLQAFLQRVVNGGGWIGREYALGSGRVDLLVRWRYPKGEPRSRQGEQRIVLELKTIRKNRSPDAVIAEGLEQIARYADASDAGEAHLVVCDERSNRSWDEKIYEREKMIAGRDIKVWGL
ncbi:MAG: PD-(D/E)XK nuclease domain-containing protein [Synergistaceae bacterium]|nr:PD-(D/E)XK nuclease domain-containing protein [Synergistaceae bacterium]